MLFFMTRNTQIAILFILSQFFIQLTSAQSLSLEDIWRKGTFRSDYLQGISWLNDGAYYTAMKYEPAGRGADIVKYSARTGKAVSTILKGSVFHNDDIRLVPEGYVFSPDENALLLEVDKEQVYRRSALAYYYIYDLKKERLSKVSEEKLLNPAFSPDSRYLAYVRNNNLYVYDTESGRETPVTSDGIRNEIINGATDWVYEEEFGFTRAFFWSPDSRRIAYYRFDETEVKEYTMQVWGSLYPENYTFKYPKAGEKNAAVEIWVYDLEDGREKALDLKRHDEQYIPRVQWTRNSDLLSVQIMNRLQNHLELLHVRVSDGSTATVYEEKSDTYVEVVDDLVYLSDSEHFVISSEKDGYRHLYKASMDGKSVVPITKGAYEVLELAGVDEKKGRIYYLSNEASVLGRHLYSIRFDGGDKNQITHGAGCHDIHISPDKRFFLDYYSEAGVPYRISLNALPEGRLLRTMVDNASLERTMKNNEFVKPLFFTFMTEDSVSLNAWMIKPQNFDSTRKYPVLVSIYGGPGHQTVLNQWGGNNYLWYQMLAGMGYIVVGVDNRGTGGRGADFKKQTYGRLGKLEAEDMIQTAKYLGSLSYVDKSRLGIFGWSFGGYLSSLAITLGADYYKLAIAVAPVTSWRFYDTIYTERFLGLPEDNPSGYDENSPISHAAMLKGRYLLIHGTADDNVHLQNAIEMQRGIIKAGKHADVLYYPDKNHSIYGGDTRFHLYEVMTNYLINYL